MWGTLLILALVLIGAALYTLLGLWVGTKLRPYISRYIWRRSLGGEGDPPDSPT